MDIRYNLISMLRDSNGIVKYIDLEMYLHGGDPLLNKQLRLELGAPSGSPVLFEDVTESDVQNWLMNSPDAMDQMVEASKAIQAESVLTSGLPWEV